MTRLEDRQTLVAEIASACAAGARLAPACGPPTVREVVRRLEMISHFQRGGTEG